MRRMKQFLGMLTLVMLLAATFFTASANVELSDFSVELEEDHLLILWETASELDNLGFHLWRGQTNALVSATRLTSSLIPSAVGGQPVGASYEYPDETVQSGVIYFYWLEAIDVNGNSDFYGPENGTVGGGGGNILPTDTPAGTSAPTSTPAPTNSPPPTSQLPASPTPQPQVTNPPPATATRPPSPTLPPPATPQLPATITPANNPVLPSPTPNSSTETAPLATVFASPTANSLPTVSLQPAITNTQQPTASSQQSTPISIGANNTPQPTATFALGVETTPNQTTSPLVWVGLAGGLFFVAGGGIALYLLIKRQQA